MTDTRAASRNADPTPRPVTVGIVVVAMAIAYVVLRLLVHENDPTAFVRVGDSAIAQDAVERSDYVIVAAMGYDGKYYYRQAREPLSTDRLVGGLELDRPAYRSARIGYPAMAWMLSGGGRPALVPWSLILVNVAAVGVVAGVGSAIARDLGRSTWWGLAFAGWPGLLIALGYDLAEPVESALALTALWLARRERYALVTLALCAAAVTRESSLIISAAFFGAWLLPRVLPRISARLGLGDGKVPLLPAIAPIGTYVAMQSWMTARWDGTATATEAVRSAEHVSSLPGVELVRQMGEWLIQRGNLDLISVIQVLLMLLFFGCALASLTVIDAGTPVERLGLLGAVLLVLMLGSYNRMVIYLRWPDVAAIFGLIVYLAASPTTRPQWLTDRLVYGSVVALFATTLPIWIAI